MTLTKRLRAHPPSLAATRAGTHTAITPGIGSRRKAAKDLVRMAPRLADLQERLFAEGACGSPRRVVLLLQGTDTSGKDGAVKHVVGLVNPSQVAITAFGPPTPAELSHDFLWRITNAVPAPGYLGVFNRSQYEDVLVARVHDLVPAAEWEQRYDLINAWEAEQTAAGVTFVKVFLHLSAAEQRRRLLARIGDVRKHWKVNPGDIDERARWEDYQEAYATLLERCSTSVAPWFVVPADRKWYRNWAVTRLLLETLTDLAPQWPVRPELDLPGMIARLQESPARTRVGATHTEARGTP